MDPVLARVLWAALLGMAVGAVLGVLFAAMGKRRRHVAAAERHALLAQFRYALDDDAETSVEELKNRVKAEDPGGVETLFALGSLLRRKGDYARAIALHEELIANAALHPSVRRAAAYELALDFRRAGMHGRAAEALERLLHSAPEHREALRELREIAEEEGDWPKAIEAQRRLLELGEGGESILGHLHAAHARALLERGRRDEAAEAVELGLEIDPGGADALSARAAIAFAGRDAAAGSAAMAAALDRCPELAGVVPLDEVVAPEAFLQARLAVHPHHPWLLLVLARHRRRVGDPAGAVETLRELLRHHDLAEARQELAEALLEGPDGLVDPRSELGALLTGLGAPARPFACTRCQVELIGFTFRCPRCFTWDSVRAATPQAPPTGGGRPGEKPPDRRTGS